MKRRLVLSSILSLAACAAVFGVGVTGLPKAVLADAAPEAGIFANTVKGKADTGFTLSEGSKFYDFVVTLTPLGTKAKDPGQILIFVPAGKSVTVDVPRLNYRFAYTGGQGWTGAPDFFESYRFTHQDDAPIDFRSSRRGRVAWSIDLGMGG